MLRFQIIKKTWRQAESCFWSQIRKMSTLDALVEDARNMYHFSIKAVRPGELVKNSIQIQSNILKIQKKEFCIDKNVYIVGFGKAVLGMAIALENLLKEHLLSGILSVPTGTLDKNTRNKLTSSKIEVFEGAQNNIPDNDSLLASKKISELVASLGKSSLLFVLISGGGSALLPSPRYPLTLEEKQTIIKVLSSRGATIEELNAVRKRLSLLKGGGLAQLANPAQVISLILSDIIGDPIDLIASGPTVQNTDDPQLPISILEKYKIRDKIPSSAIQLLENTSTENKLMPQNFDFVNNFIIGNNTTALNAAAQKALELGYKSLIMTNKLSGLASNVGEKIIQLVSAALHQQSNEVFLLCNELGIEKEKGLLLLQKTEMMKSSLCLLFGGETTVVVNGKGTGGRNQELALAASLKLFKSDLNVVVLSAGTDGIDGPTDAAGAIATPSIIDAAEKQGLDAKSFLLNNDSYNFFNSLNNGFWHVKIGHTGTNVMDVTIVLIKNG